MTAPAFAGIGGHHSPVPKTEEWYTPPAIIEALGGAESFDLDPCAPIGFPWGTGVRPYDTAKWHYCIADDGLSMAWWGRVWLNPPYSTKLIGQFLRKMAEHDRGTALIFARTETDAFFRHVWDAAHALLFIRGRLNFHLPDGSRAKANSGAPSVLCAYGQSDAEILAYCGIDGQFVPLRFPRSVLAVAVTTWREALIAWFADRRGPVELAELYRAFAYHPKTKANRNWQAKIRQTLQQGPFRNVGRGQWEPA